ncbi:MAG: cell division protein ZapE [Gammaproteobacteria bacterium]|nr:cell division protein ZapE [Gammaproteobacteria bacterium]
MKVSEYYQQAMQQEGCEADDAQLVAISKLDDVYDNLMAQSATNGLVRGWLGKSPEPVKGLYLWGGVGRGKTFLMDIFYEVLPIEQKHRLHFHRFMILIHQQLHILKKSSNALEKVASQFAKQYRVLCLDEMHITDEGDAAIMEGLLVALLERGVTLITTSNRAPDKLTDDPYIERLFSKAVDVLQQNLTVMNMDGGIDYRLRHIEMAEIWHSPLDEQSGDLLEGAFHECSAVELQKEDFIIINERNIPVVKWSDGVSWFEFGVICGPPRARIDYIEIARFFHSVLIQDIPVLDDENNDYARRFTLFIDELYDHNVKLIVSAAQPPEKLYQGTRLAFEFQRTLSRLQEMQSHEYLAREHDS